MAYRDAIALENTTLQEIIAVIDKGSCQMAMICRPDGKLVGIVTDGDLRRGLLRRISLEAPVQEVMNKQPMIVRQSDDRAQAVALMRQIGIGHIPVVDDDGKVVGVESWLEHSLEVTEGVSVAIMAGGLGSRLSPLTDEVPKPLIQVGSKPILEIIIGQLAKHGFRNIYLCINYKAEMIRRHFGDGSKWEVNITYVEEKEPCGTAGALSLLPDLPGQTLLVLNADLLTNIDFTSLIKFHNTHSHSSSGTICVREYSMQVPYGVAKMDDHQLIDLSEKPEHHFFINAGIYVLNPAALELVPKHKFFDMTHLMQELLESENKPVVFPIREYWLDIGHIDDLEQARREIDGVI